MTQTNVVRDDLGEFVASEQEGQENGYHGPEDFVRTDVNNSNQLVARYGDVLRWVPKWRTWLHYDGIRWATVSEDEVIGLAKRVLYELREEANQLTLSRETRDMGLERLSWAVSSEKGQHLELMVKYAKPDLVARPEDFDRNPDLFNVLDGTFDFATGELREHRASDMVTKLAPVTYGDGTDDHRLWARFIDDITDGDVSLAVYIQQVLGLSLSGDRSVKHVWFPNGDGDNGKTVLFELTGEVMGDYAAVGQNSDIIDHGRYSTAKPFGLANLVGKRRAVYAEIGREDRLNWSILKQISGADTTTVEQKMKQAVEAQLESKIFIYVNELPTVDQVGESYWTRIRVIPFNRCWNAERPECGTPDPYLIHKLRAHKSAVLRWMIQGEMLRREFGLLEPAAVTDATKLYREESDTLAEFLRDATYKDRSAKTSVKDLYRAYRVWFDGSEYSPGFLRDSEFGKGVRAHGYTGKTIRGKAWIVGIGLNSDYLPRHEENY